MKKPRHHVSDHALLRYFERRYGVPIEELRRRLGRELDRAYDRMALEKDMSPSSVHMNGMSFTIRNFTCVTVTASKRSNKVDSNE